MTSNIPEFPQNAEVGLTPLPDFRSMTPEQQAEYKRRTIAQVHRDIQNSWERSQRVTESLAAPPDPLREKAEKELESDVLKALSSARFSEASLAQIARYNGIPIDTVKAIAQQISEQYLGKDLERIEFESVVEQIRKLETGERDEGFREWKLQKLARRMGTTKRAMMEAYNKALINLQPVQPKPIGQFLAEYRQAEVKYLLHGWLPVGTTLLLHGDGGAGKTLMVYELMESILAGKPWNGYPTTKSEVLLVQVDEPELITADRIDVRGISPTAPLAVLSDWTVEAIAHLEAHVAKMPPESVIIVDSITAISRNSMFSENDTEYARPILQIRDMARRYRHTIILIHHSNAEGNARGTRAIHNSVDAVWGLSISNETQRLLRVQKTRWGKPPGRYTFNFDDETFSFRYLGEEGSDDDYEHSQTQQEKIRLWLNAEEQLGKVFEPIEIAERLNISAPSVRKYLRELCAKGHAGSRRKAGGRGGVYYSKLAEICDPAILQGSQERIAPKPAQHQAFEICDPAILKTDENFTVEKCEKSGSQDRKMLNPLPGKALNCDPDCDPDCDPNGGRIAIIENEEPNCDPALNAASHDAPRKGDVVLVDAAATWVRAGSDKLPWKEVPKSYRNAPQLPIEVLGQPLFRELIDGGNVIEVRGDRVKVRNVDTGRTSVFPIEHVRILKRGGQHNG